MKITLLTNTNEDTVLNFEDSDNGGHAIAYSPDVTILPAKVARFFNGSEVTKKGVRRTTPCRFEVGYPQTNPVTGAVENELVTAYVVIGDSNASPLLASQADRLLAHKRAREMVLAVMNNGDIQSGCMGGFDTRSAADPDEANALFSADPIVRAHYGLMPVVRTLEARGSVPLIEVTP